LAIYKLTDYDGILNFGIISITVEGIEVYPGGLFLRCPTVGNVYSGEPTQQVEDGVGSVGTEPQKQNTGTGEPVDLSGYGTVGEAEAGPSMVPAGGTIRRGHRRRSSVVDFMTVIQEESGYVAAETVTDENCNESPLI